MVVLKDYLFVKPLPIEKIGNIILLKNIDASTILEVFEGEEKGLLAVLPCEKEGVNILAHHEDGYIISRKDVYFFMSKDYKELYPNEKEGIIVEVDLKNNNKKKLSNGTELSLPTLDQLKSFSPEHVYKNKFDDKARYGKIVAAERAHLVGREIYFMHLIIDKAVEIKGRVFYVGTEFHILCFKDTMKAHKYWTIGGKLFEKKLATNSNLVLVDALKEEKNVIVCLDSKVAEKGDVVSHKYPPIPLETEFFETDLAKQIFVVSNEFLMYNHTKEKLMYPERDSILILPDPRKLVNYNGVMAFANQLMYMHKQHIYGTVVHSTMFKVGSKVVYFRKGQNSLPFYNSTRREYVYGETDIHFVNNNDILTELVL